MFPSAKFSIPEFFPLHRALVVIRGGTIFIVFIVYPDRNTHNKLIVVNLNKSYNRHNYELVSAVNNLIQSLLFMLVHATVQIGLYRTG